MLVIVFAMTYADGVLELCRRVSNVIGSHRARPEFVVCIFDSETQLAQKLLGITPAKPVVEFFQGDAEFERQVFHLARRMRLKHFSGTLPQDTHGGPTPKPETMDLSLQRTPRDDSVLTARSGPPEREEFLGAHMEALLREVRRIADSLEELATLFREDRDRLKSGTRYFERPSAPSRANRLPKERQSEDSRSPQRFTVGEHLCVLMNAPYGKGKTLSRSILTIDEWEGQAILGTIEGNFIRALLESGGKIKREKVDAICGSRTNFYQTLCSVRKKLSQAFQGRCTLAKSPGKETRWLSLELKPR